MSTTIKLVNLSKRKIARIVKDRCIVAMLCGDPAFHLMRSWTGVVVQLNLTRRSANQLRIELKKGLIRRLKVILRREEVEHIRKLETAFKAIGA